MGTTADRALADAVQDALGPRRAGGPDEVVDERAARGLALLDVLLRLGWTPPEDVRRQLVGVEPADALFDESRPTVRSLAEDLAVSRTRSLHTRERATHAVEQAWLLVQ